MWSLEQKKRIQGKFSRIFPLNLFYLVLVFFLVKK